ncbi:MAG: hypothetical protein CXT69_04355 [Methanobacteriota archaeon]|jgi:hypothetical protein|nr:MAG: hypothetical protein CXT69_04355 [Euryarchaeota archaeon]HIK78432.1 hypothetical protein [Candidatus Poseidoniales archaeon]
MGEFVRFDEIIVWLIVGLGVTLFAWITWRHTTSHRNLDNRLALGDEKILSDERYVVNEVMQAPLGSGVLPYALVQQTQIQQPISQAEQIVPKT